MTDTRPRLALPMNFFRDRPTWLLWPLALIWMAIIGNWGWRISGVQGKGVIVGGILMMFSPLPVALLLTRERADLERKRRILGRRRDRLARRLGTNAPLAKDRSSKSSQRK